MKTIFLYAFKQHHLAQTVALNLYLTSFKVEQKLLANALAVILIKSTCGAATFTSDILVIWGFCLLLSI